SGTCSTIFTDTVHVQNYGEVHQLHTPANELKIVPNPNNGDFDLLFDNAITGEITVRLMNIKGSIVYDKQYTIANDNKISVMTVSLPAGIYMANIYTEGAVITQKVTIDK